MNPFYHQDLSFCLTPTRKKAFGRYLQNVTVPNSLKNLVEEEDSWKTLIKDWRHVLVVGMGGAILGAKALAGANLSESNTIHVDFLENPENLFLVLERCPSKGLGIICVSKSGKTIETLIQACFLFEWCTQQGICLQKHCLVITGSHHSPLRALACSAGVTILDHPDVSGRYSVFTAAGLVPALAMGFPIKRFCAAARKILRPLFADNSLKKIPAVQGAALIAALMEEENFNATALMVYGSWLEGLVGWYRQLVCESLGKQGRGLSCLGGQAPQDQHSVLQLYLEGPRDKLITVIPTPTSTSTGPNQEEGVSAHWAQAAGVDFLEDRTVSDLTQAQQEAILQTLAQSGCAVRCLRPHGRTPEVLGAVMMHFMIETCFVGHFLGINPFNNPGVDAGKTLVMSRLKGTV